MSEHNNEPDSKNQKMIASFMVILVVVVLAVGITYFTNKKKTGAVSMDSNATSSSSNTTSSSTGSSNASSSSYKDGSYTATGSYQTPGGQETIGVTVTLKGGVVTASSLQQNGNNADTKEYQADFASGYQSKVVGKALNSISLSRVSGSSLTSQGFSDALDQIKTQAAS